MRPLYLLSLLVLATVSAQAAVDLKGVNLGQHVSGPKIANSDLAGKVVVFEYWGVNCPPCRANIPHISELAAIADPDQLIVLANHCQSPGTTLKVWQECKGTDKPTVIEGGDLPGSNVSGIPHIFVFDHTGKLTFDGGPHDVTNAMITKLLDAAPGPLVKGGPFKACASEAAALKSADRSVVSVLKALRTKAGNEKAKVEVQSEAKTLLESVKAYLDKQLAGITTDKTEDPLSAARRLNRIILLVKGDEWGKPFEEIAAQIKTDKAFQGEVRAAEALEMLKAQAAKIGLGSDPQALKRTEAASIAQTLEQLIKQFGTTKAGKEAVTLKASWFK